MSTLYFLGNTQDAIDFNQRMYAMFVTSDGVNFKNGYTSATVDYVKYTDSFFVLGDDDQALAVDPQFFGGADLAINQAYMATGITEAQAAQAGWFSKSAGELAALRQSSGGT